MYRSASEIRMAHVYKMAEIFHRSGVRIASAEDLDRFIMSGTRTLKQAGLFDFVKGLRGDSSAPTPSEVKEGANKVIAKAKKEADASDAYVYEQVQVISKELQRLGFVLAMGRSRGQFDLDEIQFRKIESGAPLDFKMFISEAQGNKKLMPFVERLHNLHTFAKTVYTGKMDGQVTKVIMGGLGKIGQFLVALSEFLGLSFFYVALALCGAAGLLGIFTSTAMAIAPATIMYGVVALLGTRVVSWLASQAGGLLDKYVRFRTASQNKVAYQQTVLALLAYRP